MHINKKIRKGKYFMELSRSMFIFLNLFLLFGVLLATSTNSSYYGRRHLCHDDERLALLQFKHSFIIDSSASLEPFASPKVLSWNVTAAAGGEASDCCSWDGVECDKETGYVIGLGLASSFLRGSINSSSSLFSLVHLQNLNLADNHFNYSRIPPEISNLSRLSSLNISLSALSGQIPWELLTLSNLVSLDLSSNVDPLTNQYLMKLESPSLRSLVQNLTHLEQLKLNGVDISSPVPQILTNLSSLRTLGLRDTGMYGDFPAKMFFMPKLNVLDLGSNRNLTGSLPEFHNLSHPLKVLTLSETGFSGRVPLSIGNLKSLSILDISDCQFSGFLPVSFGNLTEINSLSLSRNNFTVGSLSWLAKLTQIRRLELIDNEIHGELPPSLSNLTRLAVLRLGSNYLDGEIPFWLMNLTRLTFLDLSRNELQGTIPSSFLHLVNLDSLDLSYNRLNGTLEDSLFLSLKKLTQLRFSYNHISILTQNYTANTTLPKFEVLGLIACNLRKIPNFLRFQDKLEVLLLSRNNFHGQIPEWMWSISVETLGIVSLSNNFLTGFENRPVALPGASLRIIDLRNNLLQGSLPIPPPGTFQYDVSNNRLTGALSSYICLVDSLYVLDLSKNSMSGTIPPCVGNFSTSLSVLNLQGNNFSGSLSQTYTEGCNLRMMDLSKNCLEGRLPRSLASCKMLEILDVADNLIQDAFPSWLGAVPELQVMVLRSNRFYGEVTNPTLEMLFPKMRIIDLSSNMFSGDLPQKYFDKWTAMQMAHMDWLDFMQASLTSIIGKRIVDYNYPYSITMTNKGVKLMYEKVLNIFAAIDLSNNNFHGEIPESIGKLHGLQLLNLSNNQLSGPIPSSVQNLMNLECLDLSRNQLNGEIPREMTLLNFLAFLNVSDNHLTGPIPQGKPFDTFENTSFNGNTGLCGEPLSNKCGRNKELTPPPSPFTEEGSGDDEFPSGVDWVVIFMGVGSGLIVGLVLGGYLTTRNHEWLVEKVERWGWKQTKRTGLTWKLSGRRS